MNKVRSYGDDRLLDTEAKEFDDAFYEFRTSVRELEKRLASVLSQGFSDAPTLRAQFKLLDSFAGLTSRQVITEELEKRYIQMVSVFGDDVLTRRLFSRFPNSSSHRWRLTSPRRRRRGRTRVYAPPAAVS